MQTQHADCPGACKQPSLAKSNESVVQVLSDPSKRQVYDIYGKEGLTSGLEVSSAVNSAEELRKKWEKFKAQEVRLNMSGCESMKV